MLSGSSYGTKIVLVMLRDNPVRYQSAVLWSTVPDPQDPALQFARKVWTIHGTEDRIVPVQSILW